jgi:hypothetical protein
MLMASGVALKLELIRFELDRWTTLGAFFLFV